MDVGTLAALVTSVLALVGVVFSTVYSVRKTHALDKELEAVKAEINARFNMISKVQDREFKVLSRAWALLQAADMMTKAAIRQAREEAEESAIEEAMRAIDRLQRYFETNRIFIRGDLLDAFRSLDAILVEVRTDSEQLASDHTKFTGYIRDIESAKSRIEDLIRQRLPLL